ncbi:hypothetical protein ACFFGH_31500 [Lysobacter korlensis]|uniref:Uncharacterized protein n=1 Tax=Lysobacter korlensis TaxID=553636 RepID=A0ABV6RZG3_9GAMM
MLSTRARRLEGRSGDRTGRAASRRAGKAPAPSALVAAIATAVLIAGAMVANAPVLAPVSEPDRTPIEVFTIVKTGIVYVDPETSEIVWRSRERKTRTLSERPWRDAHPGGVDAEHLPWRPHRDIIGNPDHDVVAWVETAEGRRGDLVVVEAHSGNLLARAPLGIPLERPVVLASLDDEALYYATSDTADGVIGVPSEDIWVWRWAAGEEPQQDPRRPAFLNDVSAGVWAVYTSGGIAFEDADGRQLSYARIYYEIVPDFGSALSPDGRYWYGGERSVVIETTTGDAVAIAPAHGRDFGWSGAAELTLAACHAVTGRCHTITCDVTRPIRGPCDPRLPRRETTAPSAYGACLRFALPCGPHMPAN